MINSLSLVIPYYESPKTINNTLKSVANCQLEFDYFETIIVDDGSIQYPLLDFYRNISKLNIKTFVLPHNSGKPNACNYAFSKTISDTVILLDSDDLFVPDWSSFISELHKKWPKSSPLCFVHALTETGVTTGSGDGLYSREEWLSGLCKGEYTPLFRGHIARNVGYQAPGCKKICGTLSYAKILEYGPLYVHKKIFRIYNTNTPNSITKNKFIREKLIDSYICFNSARLSINDYDSKNSVENSSYIYNLFYKEAFYLTIGISRIKGFSFIFNNFTKFKFIDFVLILITVFTPLIIIRSIYKIYSFKNLNKNFG